VRARTPAASAIVIALAVVLAGCCPQAPTTAPVRGPAAPPPGTTVGARVSVEASGFLPRSVTIEVGEAVIWTNVDRARHNVGGSGLVSGVLGPGQSYAHVFDTPGTYQYICTFHPDTAEGLVVVEPH
jgi:plastocyanin